MDHSHHSRRDRAMSHDLWTFIMVNGLFLMHLMNRSKIRLLEKRLDASEHAAGKDAK